MLCCTRVLCLVCSWLCPLSCSFRLHFIYACLCPCLRISRLICPSYPFPSMVCLSFLCVAQAAAHDFPLVINNTAADRWKARKLWRLDWLQDALHVLHGVKTTKRRTQGAHMPLPLPLSVSFCVSLVHVSVCVRSCHFTVSCDCSIHSQTCACMHAGSTPFFYFHAAPMAAHEELVSELKKQSYSVSNMSFASLRKCFTRSAHLHIHLPSLALSLLSLVLCRRLLISSCLLMYLSL